MNLQTWIFGICIFMAGIVFAEPTSIKSAGTAKKSSSSEGQRLWQKFIACGNTQLTEPAAAEYVKSVAAKNLTPLELTKLHEFVNRGFEVTELTECTAQEEKSVLEADKKDHLCFKILGNKTETGAYTYFEREAGTLKITQIRY